MEQAQAAGRHLAGYFSYELGLILEPGSPRCCRRPATSRCCGSGCSRPREIVEGEAVDAVLAAFETGRAYAGPLRPEWDEPAYEARFARAHDWIGAGDIYQVNLSFRARFAFAGDRWRSIGDLRARSAAAHCAYHRRRRAAHPQPVAGAVLRSRRRTARLTAGR